MNQKNKAIGLSGVMILFALSLTGCGMSPLPDSERYQYINQVMNDVDYENAGEIVEETTDNGDGIFTPSHKKVQYKGNKTFYKLSDTLKSLENYDCAGGETQISCTRGRVSVSVSISRKNPIDTYFTISDALGGREN